LEGVEDFVWGAVAQDRGKINVPEPTVVSVV